LGGYSSRPEERVSSINAVAKGGQLIATARLTPGKAVGGAQAVGDLVVVSTNLLPGEPSGSATVDETVVSLRVKVIQGKATGFDAIKYDNDFLMIAA
jgi:hypothetical protein